MIFSALGLLVVSFVSFGLVWYPAFLLAKLLNWQAVLFGQLSWASVEINNWSIFLTFAYYGCIIILYKRLNYDATTKA